MDPQGPYTALNTLVKPKQFDILLYFLNERFPEDFTRLSSYFDPRNHILKSFTHWNTLQINNKQRGPSDLSYVFVCMWILDYRLCPFPCCMFIQMYKKRLLFCYMLIFIHNVLSWIKIHYSWVLNLIYLFNLTIFYYTVKLEQGSPKSSFMLKKSLFQPRIHIIPNNKQKGFDLVIVRIASEASKFFTQFFGPKSSVELVNNETFITNQRI